MSVLIGCVADDLTGASDIALMFAAQGMNVSLLPAMPTNLSGIEADALVIALKTRTCPVAQAVQESVEAVRQMKALGIRQVYFKYCSTFDSTDQGNIGPVIEALMDLLGVAFSVVVPAFPKNARTVYMGHLFVGDTLLSESGMRDHPLTPMHDSNLVNILKPQLHSRTSVSLVPFEAVRQGRAAIRKEFSRSSSRTICILDTVTDGDLMEIGAACDGLPLVTGASGLALGLPQNFVDSGELKAGHGAVELPEVSGPMVILAGSCSQATRAQIVAAQATMPTVHLDVEALMAGRLDSDQLIDMIQPLLGQPAVIVYSSSEPERVEQLQAQYGRATVGEYVENTLGALAKSLVNLGVRKFVVGGGETSGAVAKALGLTELKIGPEIAPGVPWTVTEAPEAMLIAFKSGNFGGRHFFNHAYRMLP